MALRIRAHCILQGHRVPLRMKLRGLFTREDRLYRPAQQICGERCLRLDRELFFCAERATAGCQLDLNLFERKVQYLRDLSLIERRSLALRKHLNAISLWQSQASFRF